MKQPVSPTFCSMVWDHQFVDPTGRVKPCCRFAEKHRPNENNLKLQSLTDIFYGNWMQDVRETMLAGERVPGCIRCYQEEDSGKRSLRQRYNSHSDLLVSELVDITNPTIKWIELAISNDCNLACRMCDSRYSWKWYKEELTMYGGRSYSETEHTKSDIANVYPFINELVHLKFTGGEPLITPDHWVLVDKLIAERDCSEIFLNYSTNCTIMPKDEWIAKWDKFKYIEFALSWDTVDPAEAAYIRWPETYDRIEAVTKYFLSLKQHHNFNYIMRGTISLLNIWHLPQTLEWWIEHCGDNVKLNPTHLTYPEELCVTVLPEHIKKKISDRFDSYIATCNDERIITNVQYIKNFMNSTDDTHLLPKLQTYIEKTDTYRNQNFFTSYPEFFDIFSAH